MRLTFDEESLVALFQEHEVMTRAQFGASSFTSILKLFGETPKYLPHLWTDEVEGIDSYDMKRSEAWQQKETVSQKRQLDIDDSPPANSGKITDIETLQHTELSIQSPINQPSMEESELGRHRIWHYKRRLVVR